MKIASSFSPLILQHYMLIKKWGSELEFLKIETSFLHRLLDEYFIRLMNSYLADDLKMSGERLLKLEKELSRTDAVMMRQFKEMKWIATNIIKENKNRIIEARREIGYQMAQVTLEFRAIRKDIFKLVEAQKHQDRLLVG